MCVFNIIANLNMIKSFDKFGKLSILNFISKLVNLFSKLINLITIKNVLNGTPLIGIEIANLIILIGLLNGLLNIPLTLLIIVLNVSNLLNTSQYLLFMLLVNFLNIIHQLGLLLLQENLYVFESFR